MINLGMFASRFEDSTLADSLQPITSFFKPGKVHSPERSTDQDRTMNVDQNPDRIGAKFDEDPLVTVAFTENNDDASTSFEPVLSLTQDFHDEIQELETESQLTREIGCRTNSVFVRNAPTSAAVRNVLMKNSTTFRAKATKPETVGQAPLLKSSLVGPKTGSKRKISTNTKPKTRPRIQRKSSGKASAVLKKRGAIFFPMRKEEIPKESSEAGPSSSRPVGPSHRTSENLEPASSSTNVDLSDFTFDHSPPCLDEPLLETDVDPISMDSIDPAVLAALPPSLRFEIASHYRMVQRSNSRVGEKSRNDSGSIASFCVRSDSCH